MIKWIRISSGEFGSIYEDQISIYVDNGEIDVKGDIIAENVVHIYDENRSK